MAQAPSADREEEVRSVVLEIPTEGTIAEGTAPLFEIKVESEMLLANTTIEDEAKATPQDLAALTSESQKMLSPDYLADLDRKILVPPSTSNPEDLEQIANMSPTARQRFLKIRSRALTPLARFFRLIRVKPSVSNKVLGELNSQLFRNAKTLGSSQREIIILGIGGSLGASLSKAINLKLQGYNHFKKIPENAGFFWALSLGLMIVKTTREGEKKYSLEPVIDFRKAKETTTPFLFGAINLIAGRIWELEKDSPGIKKSEFTKASLLTIAKSLNSFGLLLTPGAAFPPMTGYGTSVARGESHQVAFSRAGLKSFVEAAHNYLKERRPQAHACRQSLSAQ